MSGLSRYPVVYGNSADNLQHPKTGENAPISTHVGGGNAMVLHHFVSQLVLFALLWLCIILLLTRPKPTVVASAAPVLPAPLKLKRHRPHEPTPFRGLTHKPSYALCERDTAYPTVPPPVSPAPMLPTNRRPRAVATSRPFWPHAGC